MAFWFIPAFFVLFILVFVVSIWQKVSLVKRAKLAHETKDPTVLQKPEVENEIGLLVVNALLYFFLSFWVHVTTPTRTGRIAEIAEWWIMGVRIYLVAYSVGLISLMLLRKVAKNLSNSDFQKRYEVDAPKLKSLRDSLALFTFFLVFFTIVGLVALIFLNPEFRK